MLKQFEDHTENIKGMNDKIIRASTATHLLESGNNIVNIQKLLGHKNITTTMIYTKLASNNLDDIKSPL